MLGRARIDQPIATAPVICVTVSQLLCRSLLNNGSWRKTNAARMNPDGRSRVQVRQLEGGRSDEIHRHSLPSHLSWRSRRRCGCRSDYGPDLIFQGAFDEMQRADKKVDPKALAASLGFTAAPIRTLETGCKIDVHFVDDTTAEIGLNNYVYTLKKH